MTRDEREDVARRASAAGDRASAAMETVPTLRRDMAAAELRDAEIKGHPKWIAAARLKLAAEEEELADLRCAFALHSLDTDEFKRKWFAEHGRVLVLRIGAFLAGE